ncbi:NADPH-dependent FMN reductase [Cesiribacter sp. SM1]|uniref:NADPH-dependent FMN reductase n=1 Tax=Cesiribacter sp. SM1 TaxID=2861196 RepID=UPI001CD318A7|nr:NAD(P)H-dependent oxidoreductase [Cesiribacter sp. SM1]
MAEHIHLVGLSGSLRKKSLNTYLLHAVKEVLPEGVSLEIASVADLPLYNADLDIPAADERPKAVATLRQTLAKADGLIFSSPEYNYSIPGGLKNMIDWASRGKDSPLVGKAVALIGATPGLWGTVRMQQAFLPVFQYLDMKYANKPEILVAQANQKFDEHGKLTDETTRELLGQKMEALKQLILDRRALA